MGKYIVVLFLLVTSFNGWAQIKITTEEYISQYKDIAIKEMNKFGIPASITLAQGLLESDNGNSTLAQKANNHFGIKCHNDWNGATFTYDDDKKDECFRKYKNAEQSFYDHSEFLVKHQRYAFLFELKTDDYKGWAHGLKKAGYATNPHYANLLIKIIEDNQLYRYDITGSAPTTSPIAHQEKIKYLADDVDNYKVSPFGKEVYSENRIDFIIVDAGETAESIAEKQGIRPWQIYKYNEITADSILKPGQRLYLQPKRKKASVQNKTYTVQTGETMYSISQEFGIRLKNLYQLNAMEPGSQPKIGDTLSLRKKKKADR